MKDHSITPKHLLVISLCAAGTSLAQTLSLKANIGVCACWDSISLNVYELTGLKVGTFGILINTSLVIIQWILVKKSFSWIKFLQVPLCILSGLVTNFLYYDLFTFDIHHYLVQLVFLLLSFLLLAVFVGCMTLLDVVTMPLEAVCYVIEQKTGSSFGKNRQIADIAAIALSLFLSFVFGLSLKIREGTVIGLVILGPLMHMFMRVERKFPFIKALLKCKEKTLR